jgi:hypothetical protein
VRDHDTVFAGVLVLAGSSLGVAASRVLVPWERQRGKAKAEELSLERLILVEDKPFLLPVTQAPCLNLKMVVQPHPSPKGA